jgi:hypothetical protein
MQLVKVTVTEDCPDIELSPEEKEFNRKQQVHDHYMHLEITKALSPKDRKRDQQMVNLVRSWEVTEGIAPYWPPQKGI